VQIELLPGAITEAEEFLADHAAPRKRLRRVASLVEGFETPYGMELLASVHWVTTHGDSASVGPDSAIQRVHGWNDRKRKMFRSDHIRIAWERLCDEGWLPS
jgi:hypothetical protein